MRSYTNGMGSRYFILCDPKTKGLDGSSKHPQNIKHDKRCRNESWGTANSSICIGGSGNKFSRF